MPANRRSLAAALPSPRVAKFPVRRGGLSAVLALSLFGLSAVAITAAAPITPLAPKVSSVKDAFRDLNDDRIPDRLGETVLLEGILTSDPIAVGKSGTLANLQDATGGVALLARNPAVLTPQFRRGDRVLVRGKIDHSKGTEQLAIESIQRRSRGPLPPPRDVLAADLAGERFSGQLVKVEGRLEVPGGRFSTNRETVLKDRSGQIEVAIPERLLTNLRFAERLTQGGNIELIGIAGQYKEEPPYNSGYRLVPRDGDDFRFTPRLPFLAIAMTLASLVLIGGGYSLWSRRRTAEARAREMLVLTQNLQRSEKALRESEARLRLIIDQVPAVLWTTDLDLRFTSATGAGLATMGLKPDQLVGRTIAEHFQSNDAACPLVAAHRRVIAGESATYETLWARRTCECHLEPLHDGEGRCVGAIGLALDITERKQTEEALRQSEAQFRHS